MELTAEEECLVFSFLLKHEKELNNELVFLLNKLEKKLYSTLTVEEIQKLGS